LPLKRRIKREIPEGARLKGNILSIPRRGGQNVEGNCEAKGGGGGDGNTNMVWGVKLHFVPKKAAKQSSRW